ncbi:MAG: hypothetical protein HYW50_05310 [Candidatus Diapherotrites archaeon]|nr:hypothetical protein [Candidatus Diapherotrites archaeon]
MIEKQVDIESLKAADRAKKYGFPYCKGLFPDCPDKPDKNHPMCRTCPVLDEDFKRQKGID